MLHKYFFLSILSLLVLLAVACKHKGPALPASRHKTVQHRVYAITHVNVITMVAGPDVVRDATVIIKDRMIVSLNGPVPDSALVIDGKGKWLIPGLIDMHVHIPVDGHFNTTYPTRTATVFTNTQDIMTPFVANGVTTVFELNARAGHFGQRNEILRGDVIGPRMALAAMIEGGSESGRIAHTPEEGRQSVRLAKAEGYEFIKVYSHLSRETFSAIVDEAGKLGMKVTGHIPNAFAGRIEEAFVPHFGMVAHAEEYAKKSEEFSDDDAHRFARLAKANGTWLIPTLTIIERSADQARSLDSIRNLYAFQYVHPLLQSKWLTANIHYNGTNPARIDRFEKMMAFNRKLVKAFNNAGVPIVAGTDAGCSGVVWGFSLQDEIELMTEAGLTPGESLVSATRLPAEWLGIDKVTGTVEAGKFADLVLLNANPLENIRNIREINGVFVNGRWLGRTELDAMLSDLSARNTAARNRYDWSKRHDY